MSAQNQVVPVTTAPEPHFSVMSCCSHAQLPLLHCKALLRLLSLAAGVKTGPVSASQLHVRQCSQLKDCLPQVFICLGILTALALGLPLEHGVHSVTLFGTSVAWWRVMLGLAVLPAVAQVWGTV